MKTYKKVLFALLAVLPALCSGAAVLFFLPDTVAAHFGIEGGADRWGSKYEAFIFPAVILVFAALYLIIRYFIKRSSSDENDRVNRNLDISDSVIICVLLMFNVLCIFLLIAMGKPSVMSGSGSILFIILGVAIGAMFVIIGNIMPKTKINNMLGMRLSFAMDTDEHWYIANRAGGIAMVVTGFATALSGIILRSGLYIIVMLGSLIITLTVAIIYSYVKIKGEKAK